MTSSFVSPPMSALTARAAISSYLPRTPRHVQQHILHKNHRHAVGGGLTPSLDALLLSVDPNSSAAVPNNLPVPPYKSLRHALGLPPLLLKTRMSSSPRLLSTSTSSSSLSSMASMASISTSSLSSSSTASPKIIGHRGALYDELENTRPAFQRCADLGVYGIELDVFLIKDGSLVVFHGAGTDEQPGDYSQHMVTNQEPGGGFKSIMDLTYDECQALRFNPDYKEFVCCPPTDDDNRKKMDQYRIPLLRDVLLDMKKTGTRVKIELKGTGAAMPVVELVEELDMVNQCAFSSFDHAQLKALREQRPARDAITGRHVYQTGALFSGKVPVDYIQQARDCGVDEVQLRYDTCTVDRIDEIHAAGFGSMAWFRGPLSMQSDLELRFWDVGSSSSSSSSGKTSDGLHLEDAATYRTVLETGVQQICINRPDIAMGMLDDDDDKALMMM